MDMPYVTGDWPWERGYVKMARKRTVHRVNDPNEEGEQQFVDYIHQNSSGRL